MAKNTKRAEECVACGKRLHGEVAPLPLERSSSGELLLGGRGEWFGGRMVIPVEAGEVLLLGEGDDVLRRWDLDAGGGEVVDTTLVTADGDC